MIKEGDRVRVKYDLFHQGEFGTVYFAQNRFNRFYVTIDKNKGSYTFSSEQLERVPKIITAVKCVNDKRRR